MVENIFDPRWYLAVYPDVAEAGIEPLAHFLRIGARAHRSPHPLFDAAFYLQTNPDVAAAGADPLQHFLTSGAREGRHPHRMFDTGWYRAQEPTLAADANPLLHYLAGQSVSGSPHPLFDVDFYRRTNPDVAAAGLDPLVHYVTAGAAEGRSPHTLFDAAFYLRTNPDVAAAGADPLQHFLTSGAQEGRHPHQLFDMDWYRAQEPTLAADANPLLHYLAGQSVSGSPHPLFDADFYRQTNPDVAGSGLAPFMHYMSVGARQGRNPNPLFEAAWYATTYGEADFEARRNPLAHYLSDSGRSLSTNPNRYFDRNWYLHRYPDVVAAHLEPLTHFLAYGSREGRDPGPLFSTSAYLSNSPDVKAAGLDALAHFLSSGEAEGREPLASPVLAPKPIEDFDLTDWYTLNSPSPAISRFQRRLAGNFIDRPTISIIVPIYIVRPGILQKLIDSVLGQSYTAFELCMAVAYHEDPRLLEVIDRAALQDPRVKVRYLTENRGISHNSNDALQMATGEFVALLDHDDTLPSDALFEMAQTIVAQDGDLFYSDKDAITEDGSIHFNALLKADWSPETMLAANYLTHFNVIRRSLLNTIGGWDPTTDGAQDWDLFLRLAAAGARIRHVSKMLYHWRHVPTSVAAGGLAVKPYAARGQLVTLERWLESQGWTGVRARHDAEGHIRFDWNRAFLPRVALVLFGRPGTERAWRLRLEASPYGVTLMSAGVVGTVNELWAAIERADADIVIIAPSALIPASDDWFVNLVAPLQNSDIGAVSSKVVDRDGRVLDAGWVATDGFWKPIFRGGPDGAYGAFGSVNWMRNYSTSSFNGVAIRKSALQREKPPVDAGRPDLPVMLGLSERGHRLVFNPAAVSVCSEEDLFENWLSGGNQAVPAAKADPFFNVHLTLNRQGQPILRAPAPRAVPQPHNYEGEAGYFGATLEEMDPATLNRSSDASRPLFSVNPSESDLKRIAWVVPDFTMPFYGGILTILRAAEHLRLCGFRQVFIGLGTQNPETLRAAIAKAFPELAADSKVVGADLDTDRNLMEVGPLEAAFATLWTTAYVVQRLPWVRRRFYFVQDYEPLFYPAGTTSSLVEATYRFGFFGVCNTEPLSRLYRDFGSPADHFQPAVDRAIFHQNGRREAAEDAPVVIFNYARPGHPRNCFELLAPSLGDLKREFGAKIDIYTAGADWSPADYGLAGLVEHLGLLSYAQTADLYRACDIGVVAMATCHPSYLPFELMATGAIVCTNYNKYTGWLLEHGQNCYQFELSKRSIRHSLREVIRDSALRQRLRENASVTIDRYSSWQATCNRIAEIVTREIAASRTSPQPSRFTS